MNKNNPRFDWELSEIISDEIIRRQGIDEKKLDIDLSNHITEIADNMASSVMDELAQLGMDIEFEDMIRNVKK